MNSIGTSNVLNGVMASLHQHNLVVMDPTGTSKVLSGVITSLNDAINTMDRIELTRENQTPVLETIHALKDAVKDLAIEVDRLGVEVMDISPQAASPSPSPAPSLTRQSIPASEYHTITTSPKENDKVQRGTYPILWHSFKCTNFPPAATPVPTPKNVYLPLTPIKPIETKVATKDPTKSRCTVINPNLPSHARKTLFLPLTPTNDEGPNATTRIAITPTPDFANLTLPQAMNNTGYEDRHPPNSVYEYRTDIAAPYEQYDTDNFKADSYNALLLFPPRPQGWIHQEPMQQELGESNLQDENGGKKLEDRGSGDSEDGSVSHDNDPNQNSLEVDFTNNGRTGHGDTSTQDCEENKRRSECGLQLPE